MFIYKITVEDKVYIGFDTKQEYLQSRWKSHCRETLKGSKRKVHVEMARVGIENCEYQVLESGFKNIVDLALAEIEYIKKYNSFKNGLNSSAGGDGLGKHDLASFSENDFLKIKESLGNLWTEYNIKKWANTTQEERKRLTAHLHTNNVYQKKSETLKKFYDANPESKKVKGIILKKWHLENKEISRETNKKNGMIGAMKMAKPVIVETQEGNIESYPSRAEFTRKTGIIYSTLVDNARKGLYYKGYKVKEFL